MTRFVTFVTLLTLAAGVNAQNPSRTSLPVPDVDGFKTLKGDFHIHTVFSDGRVWPSVHVQEAWRDGLDVIALTEHLEYLPHRDDVRVDPARSYIVAKPLADQLGLLLIPGVEITKPDPYTAPAVLPDGSAHFNALFVRDAAALNTPDLMEALQRARAQDAFVFWNHPRFRVSRARWFAHVATAFDAGLFRGMELVNGPDMYEEAFPWVGERQLTILANSDAHDPTPPRATGHRRPITLVFAKTADVDGVRDALLARRTAAWLADDVWGDEQWLEQLWSGAISVETSPAIRRPGTGLAIRLRNRSAIPMHAVVREAPPWFTVTGGALTIPAESTVLLRPSIARDAPSGRSLVSLRLEITNLHIAPGRSLQVTLRLDVENRNP